MRNFQISLDLLLSLTTHAVNNHQMNETIRIIISIVSNARSERNSHIKKNLDKSFDFSSDDVMSRSNMIEDFNSLQLSLNISMFDHRLKKQKAEEFLK